MKNENHIYYQYGLNLLPIIVNAIRNREAGPKALRDFLKVAREELGGEVQMTARQRLLVTKRTHIRRERIQVNRYYDLDRRSRQALKLALDALQSYLDQGNSDDDWLEQAMVQYDTSTRIRSSQIKTRMKLLPMVCERISRAC